MVCPQGVPVVRGGAERLWEGVVREINARTPHTAELIAVASPEANLRDVIHSYARFDALDLSHFDLVISGKYPAWMIRHPRHVVYMAHPIRGLYDTYTGPTALHVAQLSPPARALAEAVHASMPGRPGAREPVLDAALRAVGELAVDHPDLAYPGPLARAVVRWLDHDALDPSNTIRHLAISRTVASRAGYFPDDNAVDVVVPPTALTGLHEGPGRHIFTASRLDGPKRIELLIDAMAYIDAEVELRIAGTGPLLDALRQRAATDHRITFLGFVGDDHLAEEYANSIAVPFVPMDEDLGLITLEAQLCGKPVVTCTDSGGPTELVDDEVDGFVVPPVPFHIARALRRLIDDPELAERLGRSGRRRAKGVTWDRVVQRLLDPPDVPLSGSAPARRPRIVALSTYPAVPTRHGGQVRLRRLLAALADRADVHLLAVDPAATGQVIVAPGFVQTGVAPSGGYYELEQLLRLATGVPCSDIAATLRPDQLGELPGLVVAAATGADAVILEQPYLRPLIPSGVPTVVYDAQNAEYLMKRAMYQPSPGGTAAAEAVRAVEASTVRSASMITAVSEEDAASLARLAPSMADVVIIPNGGDVRTTPFITGIERRRRRCGLLEALRQGGLGADVSTVALFVGSGHPPNITAAHHLIEIAADLPNTLFVLVGTHVGSLGGTPAAVNVVARGVVEPAELRYLLSACDVALNPMESGSGTNIKMLDYFAAGAPVISTETGARGLGAAAGVHYTEAGLSTFADAITSCVHAPDHTDRLAATARGFVERYDWAELGKHFADSVLTAISASANRPS
jgi:glycosyltransferase involved in cell wall biosynthesis